MAFAGERAARAKKNLERLDLVVEYSEYCFEISDDGQTAGSAETRAHDLHMAFADEGVRAVMSAVAGYFTEEVLAHLDAELLARSPRTYFIGRSGNVYLNAFLYSQLAMPSFYGITFLPQFGEAEPFAETVACFQQVLMTDQIVTFRPSARRFIYAEHVSTANLSDDELPRVPERPGLHRWLRPGSGAGPLVGGEVSLLPDIVARGLLDTNGSVLFWDVGSGEPEYAVTHFRKLAGVADLQALSGMVVADNPWLPVEAWIEVVETLLSEAAPGARYPILVGAECGHFDPTWTLPYGAVVELDSEVGLVLRSRSRYSLPAEVAR
jgi:muramoyltetrapeptide carboxypeptidase